MLGFILVLICLLIVLLSYKNGLIKGLLKKTNRTKNININSVPVEYNPHNNQTEDLPLNNTISEDNTLQLGDNKKDMELLLKGLVMIFL